MKQIWKYTRRTLFILAGLALVYLGFRSLNLFIGAAGLLWLMLIALRLFGLLRRADKMVEDVIAFFKNYDERMKESEKEARRQRNRAEKKEARRRFER